MKFRGNQVTNDLDIVFTSANRQKGMDKQTS